jgi:hypothetical protein
LFATSVSLTGEVEGMRIQRRRSTRRSIPQVSWLRHGLAAVVLSLSSAEAVHAQSVGFDEQTVVTIKSSDIPGATDGSIIFTASVTQQGGGVPGGTIQFIDETTMAVLGWANVAAPSITVNNLTAGRHLIRAYYGGTADFLPLVVQPGRSAALTQAVLVKPDVTVSSSPSPCRPGQVVTLTAMVTSKIGTPKGTVTFSDGGSVIAAHVRLDHGGTASFTTMALTDGQRGAVVATYEGDGEQASAVSQRLVQDVGAARLRDTMLFRGR